MLNRYLGNKTVLLDPIMAAIGAAAKPGRLVCDIFAGSLAVSMTLKTRGYRVASNDINLFSSMYGRAFLLNSDAPAVPLDALTPADRCGLLHDEANAITSALVGLPGYAFLEDDLQRERYVDFVALMQFLQTATPADVPTSYRRSDFYDTYTEEGANSAFISARGTPGRRRFFSGANGRQIDVVLNLLRFWRREHLVAHPLHALLLTVLLDAVEKVSNTQGTYHDFPRESYDPRSLKPLRLIPPPFDHVHGRTTDHIVGCEDSLDFIRRVPEHDVLYIDPPYNFRQYTAYYFLPNIICRYPDLDDPASYFAKVRYVRGQNPEDDFVSTFCKPRQFIPSLRSLVEAARTRTVVLSYFDGRNHWNEFKSEANGEGLRRLKSFFRSALFRRGSLEVIPIPRTNYQSYGGYKARPIQEYLFVAVKS